MQRNKGKGDSLFALKTGPNKSESMDLFFVLKMDSIKTNQWSPELGIRGSEGGEQEDIKFLMFCVY